MGGRTAGFDDAGFFFVDRSAEDDEGEDFDVSPHAFRGRRSAPGGGGGGGARCRGLVLPDDDSDVFITVVEEEDEDEGNEDGDGRLAPGPAFALALIGVDVDRPTDEADFGRNRPLSTFCIVLSSPNSFLAAGLSPCVAIMRSRRLTVRAVPASPPTSSSSSSPPLFFSTPTPLPPTRARAVIMPAGVRGNDACEEDDEVAEFAEDDAVWFLFGTRRT